MRNFPFDRRGKFYKGNLHAHSTDSDGRLSPEGVVQAYRERGYDFVSITDHYMHRFDFPVTDTTMFRDEQFTTLLGAELHGGGMENGELWHIVANGLPIDFEPQGPNEDGAEIAERAIHEGAFVTIGHPGWNGVTERDVERLTDFDAVEIYNHGHTNDCDRGNGWLLADILATKGYRFSATAADDAHFRARPDTFGGWVQVMSESLDPVSLLHALKDGAFYSSTGPAIHTVELRDETIYIECDPASAIFFGGRGSIKSYKREEGQTHAEMPIAPFLNSFCRITVLAADGTRAWTSPIWLDEMSIS